MDGKRQRSDTHHRLILLRLNEGWIHVSDSSHYPTHTKQLVADSIRCVSIAGLARLRVKTLA